MTPTVSRRGVLVADSPKSEEVFEIEELWDDVFGSTYHLEGHHFMNRIRSQHLDVAPVTTEELLLEVGQRQTKASVERF